MSYEIDVHTHTIASGHAYSTMMEMVQSAKDKGLRVLGITEHAKSMPGTCSDIYFRNLRIVPRTINGVRLLLGVELNILNADGDLDMKESTMEKLDVRIASIHSNIFKTQGEKELHQALANVLKNPYVDILGHPDDGRYPYDYQQIAEMAAEHHKIVEINNASLRPTGIRPNAYENDLRLLAECKKCKVSILMGSDAHICMDVGACEMAEQVIKEVDYPKDLVLNYDAQKVLTILEEHRQMLENAKSM